MVTESSQVEDESTENDDQEELETDFGKKIIFPFTYNNEVPATIQWYNIKMQM